MPTPLRARHWIIFLLVNVLVSAVTAFLVVRTFTQAVSHPARATAIGAAAQASAGTMADVTSSAATETNATLPVAESPSPAQGESATTETAPQPMTTPRLAARSVGDRRPSVRISAVVYPGQRTREAVVIVNEGDDVDLTGWTLSNPRGKVYTFGNVALFRESFINLHTTSGVDVPTDLFWNQTEAVWQPGDEVVLRRGDEVIATYVVR